MRKTFNFYIKFYKNLYKIIGSDEKKKMYPIAKETS